jgi:hypothetical protein
LTSTKLVKDLFDHIDSGHCRVPNIDQCTAKVHEWFQAAFPHGNKEESKTIGSLHWRVFLNGFGMFFGMYNNYEVNRSQYAKLLKKYGLEGELTSTTTTRRAARVFSPSDVFTSLSDSDNEGSGEFDPPVR